MVCSHGFRRTQCLILLIDDSIVAPGPSLKAQGKQRERSQTAPVIRSVPHAPPLRKTKTASAHLETLKEVYEALSNEADVPLEELVEATRQVQRLGTILTEQMSRRLQEGSR